MKLVVHNVKEMQRKQSDEKKEDKEEPPTGVLISFD